MGQLCDCCIRNQNIAEWLMRLQRLLPVLVLILKLNACRVQAYLTRNMLLVGCIRKLASSLIAGLLLARMKAHALHGFNCVAVLVLLATSALLYRNVLQLFDASNEHSAALHSLRSTS